MFLAILQHLTSGTRITHPLDQFFPRIRGILACGLLLTTLGCDPNGRPTPSEPLGDEPGATITIGGSVETYDFLETLAQAYAAEVPVEFSFLPGSQTSGGIAGVKAGVIDLGGVSRVPEPDEMEISVDWQYQPFVQNVLVLITNTTVEGITNLTTEQIQAIYRGDIINWQDLGGPDAEIVVIDIPEDESEKVIFRRAHLGADLEITDRAVVFTDDDELLDAVASSPYSIAVVPLEREQKEDLPIQILRIDGIEPTQQNILSQDYKMSQTLGVVFAAEPTEVVRRFLDFGLSPAGNALLTEDYIVVD
jgi:phosphate transport system substrate-binding protein